MLDRELSIRSSANIGKKLRDHEHVETQADDPKKTNIIIGIDYGTSFSGAAYTLYTRRPREPHVTTLSDWPHAHSHHRSSQKVPSDIAFDESGIAYCGFDIPEDSTRLKWVKLLLETDPSEKHTLLLQSEEVNNTRSALARIGKSPVEAVAEYLKWLWTTICETITDEQNDPDLLASSNVTVMMTVPAMWSDAAKENTFQAAELAGISSNERTLKFITEPEAAAIAELQIRISNGQLSESDCVIICDAGGGTVDLVSYRVKSVEPMELDQVVVADGGLCGSSYIDQAFLAQIRSIMQSDWDRLSPLVKDEIKERFAYSIEPSFDGQGRARKETIQLYPEQGQFDHIKNGRLVVEPQVVRVAFETVVPQILSLIDEQEMALEEQGLRSKLKGILLVGGLGSSRFVHSRIEQNYGRDEQVKVWRGRQSWSSVVEGAVKCAFMSLGNIYQIQTRLSRFNYGIPFHPPFDPSEHRPEDRFLCPYEGTVKARLVQWLVRKGQEVKPGDAPQVFDFTKIVRSIGDGGNVSTGFSLLQSSEDNAPGHVTSLVKDYVKVECYFNSQILQGSWHRSYESQPDNPFWKVVVQLQVYQLPAQIIFQCLLAGQSMVSTQVSYRSNEQPRTFSMDQGSKGLVHPTPDRQPNTATRTNSLRTQTSLMSSEPVDFRTPGPSITSPKAFPTPDPRLGSRSSRSTIESRSTDTTISSDLMPNSRVPKSDKKRFFWRRESRVLSNSRPEIVDAEMMSTNANDRRKTGSMPAVRESVT